MAQRWVITLEYPDGPELVTGGRQEVREEKRCYATSFEDGGRGP